ncbi:hypothetical protein LIER_23035 [Lithospermum erythrorhizon]|uniref:Uncharacterized protein n=1 Tax=Lithospermum erythrorhizon TaxID=34254 RepID=A0AAV3QXI3_LITER
MWPKRAIPPVFLPLPYTLPGDLVINESSVIQRNRKAFMAVKPLMLKPIGQTFDSFHDPLEIHGASMSRVIESMNASYVLACKVHEGLDREKAQKAQLDEAKGNRYDELKVKYEQLEKDSQARAADVEKTMLVRDQEIERADEAEAKLKEI